METGKYDVYTRAKKVCHENLLLPTQPQYSGTPQITQCAREAASFWRENAITVVIPLRGFSPDVVVTKTRYQMLENNHFVIGRRLNSLQ